MIRICPRYQRRFTWRARLLLATAAALALAAPALGQEGGLRGAVWEDEVNSPLLARRDMGRQQQTRPPLISAYEPISAGALPELRTQPETIDNVPAEAIADPFAEESLFGAPAETTDLGLRLDPEAETPPQRATRQTLRVEEEEEETPEGVIPAGRVDDEVALTLDPGAERARAVEAITRRRDENPYDPLGQRLGTFVLRSSLEQGLTATSNVTSSAGGESAVLSETTLRLNAVSDWPEHQATLDAYGVFRKSVDGEELEETEGGVDATLRLDLADEMRATAAVGYERRPESASSPAIITSTVERPFLERLDGSLGLERDLGRLRISLRSTVEHERYGDAELLEGGTVSQSDRDSTLATVALRSGYEISPALTPFAELELGRRLYDEERDTEGFERSSDRIGARAGLELDISEKLTGEMSVGWLREAFDDERLDAIDALTLDGSLAWSPQRGTIIGLAASTEVEVGTSGTDSGSLLYSGNLTLDREIRANLTGRALLGAAYRDYADTNDYDLTLAAEAGLTWWLNRYAGLTGRVRHEEVVSSDPGRETDTSSIFIGLKLQH